MDRYIPGVNTLVTGDKGVEAEEMEGGKIRENRFKQNRKPCI